MFTFDIVSSVSEIDPQEAHRIYFVYFINKIKSKDA